MNFNKSFLDNLSEKARESERLRMHYDLRDSLEDGSMRMLNAIEPGSVIPVHRHTMTSEDVVIIRGRAEEVFYNEDGMETGRWLLEPGENNENSCPAIHVPAGQYHTCQSLKSGTVIIEFKNTMYDPKRSEEMLEV